MIDLLSGAHSILRDQGFRTRVISIGKASGLAFEDDSVLGFVYVFEDSMEIVDRWHEVEKQFLLSYSSRFRVANEKAWNIYSVLLSTADTDSEGRRKIRWVEEDLKFTRKLTACGLKSRQDLVTTLLPLLGLQKKPFLQGDAFRARLQRRLQKIAGASTDAILNEAVSPLDAARLLRDSLEN